MSEENVEVVRRMYEAFHGGDAEKALSHFDPDVFVDASRRIGGRIGRGREELREGITEWMGAFDAYHEEIDEMHAIGDKVVVALTMRGRGKGSGAQVEARFALLYGLRDRRIVSLVAYPSRGEAFEAAGLSE